MSQDIIEKIQLAEPGKLFKKQEVNRKLNLLSKKSSKWKTLTENHQFEIGDVYILPNIAKEVNTFRAYIKQEFGLTVKTYTMEKQDKIAGEIVKQKLKKKR